MYLRAARYNHVTLSVCLNVRSFEFGCCHVTLYIGLSLRSCDLGYTHVTFSIDLNHVCLGVFM